MSRFIAETVPHLLEEVIKALQGGDVFLEGLISRVSDALEIANMREAVCRSILIDNPKDTYFLDYQREAKKCVKKLQEALTYLVFMKEQTRWVPMESP